MEEESYCPFCNRKMSRSAHTWVCIICNVWSGKPLPKKEEAEAPPSEPNDI